MIGYGELMLREMAAVGFGCEEYRTAGLFTGRGKLGRNIDRFVVTPFKVMGQKADIIHAVDPGNAVYFPILRAKKFSVTVHDIIPYLAASGRLKGFQPSCVGVRLMQHLITRFKQSDGIVVVSDSTRRDLIEVTGVEESKVRVIPNALFQNLRRMDDARVQIFLATKRLPRDKPLILSIGRNFYKNREGVIEVFAGLLRHRKNAHLVFVSSPTQELRETIGRLGLSDHVSFLNYVAKADMAALYSAACALLFPSLYEGFGYPILEAQMCGTPSCLFERRGAC